MSSTTHHDAYATRANPVGHSFWLVVAMGFVILVMVGRVGPAVEAAQPQFDADDLLRLADPTETEATFGATGAPPELIEAPRLADSPARDSSAIATGQQLAGPTASVENGPSENTAKPDTSAEGQTLEPAAALAATEPLDGDPGSPTARGEAALAKISYPWQQLLPDWTIDFLPEKNGLYGLTLVPEKRIEVYVRDSQTEELLAHVIAHELGHAIDVTLNDGPERRAWEEARGIGSSPWWPGNGTTDFSTGAGDFAESFAAWQVGGDSFRSTLADRPTRPQIELLAQLAAG